MPFDAFLKIQGIEGESTDKVHPGEIVLTSFSWGESNSGSAGSGGGGGAGKTSLQDFHFTMASSKASPSLLLTCAIGRTIQSAILTCRSRGGGGFEFIELLHRDCAGLFDEGVLGVPEEMLQNSHFRRIRSAD